MPSTEKPSDTGLPESGGAWDQTPRTPDVPWHPPLEVARSPSAIHRWYRRLGPIVLILGALLLLAALIIPPLLPSKIATNGETAYIQNLKALATAQAQYYKKYDCYAPAGWRLNAGGTLIAPDLSDAFEDWQSNGDKAVPAPKAGYVFRMLQGDAASGPTGFHNKLGDPNAGMRTWGATNRAANPQQGPGQYVITEAGVVYGHAEPPPGDPSYNQFLFDHVPTQAELSAGGWFIAK